MEPWAAAKKKLKIYILFWALRKSVLQVDELSRMPSDSFYTKIIFLVRK